MDIARWTKYYRTQAGLTQRGLAEKAGISQGAVFLLENGKSPNLKTLVLISEVLAVPIEALLYGPMEHRKMAQPAQVAYADGYKKALEDMLKFCKDRVPTIMKTIHGQKGQRAFKNIIQRLIEDDGSRKLFSDLNGSVVVRVAGTGEVEEIC